MLLPLLLLLLLHTMAQQDKLHLSGGPVVWKRGISNVSAVAAGTLLLLLHTMSSRPSFTSLW
jgi:hypothetical protein